MRFFKYFTQNQDAPKPASTPTPEPTVPPTSLLANKLPVVLGVLFVVSAITALYLHDQVLELKKNPNQAAMEESQAVIAAVGRLIILPDNEQPTIATVSDPSKLKDQPFFASAKIGDKVLIYTNAKKAILYSPEENKIVEVAPVNIGNQAAAEPQVSGTATRKK